MDFNNIPQELKILNQWVVWGVEKDNIKCPYTPATLKRASAGQPDTWGSFVEAVQRVEAGAAQGVGFEFNNNGICGVDIDHAIKDGELTDEGQKLVTHFNSYTEISMSGTGLHIFVKSDLKVNSNKKPVEMYSHGHYIAMTGDICGDLRVIQERPEALQAAYDKYLKPAPPPAPRPLQAGDFKADEEYLNIGLQKDQKLSDLWEGRRPNGNESADDQGLMNKLAYWCNGNESLMQSAFINSPHYSQKDDKHIKKSNRADYIPRTAREAISKLETTAKEANERYRAQQPPPPARGSVEMPKEPPPQDTKAEKKKYLETSAAHHINALMGEIAASADTPATPTGFTGLDEALDGGLYEGLYVIGAISSLGKTTFIMQVADQIAQRGHDVLVFSLEMSRFELMAKSISRLTLENCNGSTGNAKTTRGILAGARRKHYNAEEKALINRSMSDYAEYAQNIYIHEGIGTIGAEQIKEQAKKHIEHTGHRPVVIVDYLQIISPVDMRASDKQNTDRAVLELKRLSRDKKIPVIAVSSFNRDNYTAPVNLASFKESGAIEYSSDILLGLQLAGMDELSQSEGKRADTIRSIEQMKAAEPRKAQLKILKNRNGKIGISLYYDYYPMFNMFRETASPTNDEAAKPARRR